MSPLRAQAIAELILESGAAAEVLETCSHREGNPLVARAGEVEEPGNRRVEIAVR